MFVKVDVTAYWYHQGSTFEVYDNESEWPEDEPNDRNTVFDGHITHYRLKDCEKYIRKDHCVKIDIPAYDLIVKGICPKCKERLIEWNIEDWKDCLNCKLRYSLADDMGPNRYKAFDLPITHREIILPSFSDDDEGSLSELRRDAPVSNIDPGHYRDGKIEVIEFIMDKNLNFNRGNAIKYVVRAGKKNPDTEIEDIKKAIRYLEFELERLKA